MPRRNRQFLLLAVLTAIVCWQRAGHAQRDAYGRMVVQAFGEIEQYYLERTDPEQLFEGAMQGLMSQLDDYSEYVGASDYTELQADLDQEFGGVGLQLALDDETRELTVITPLLGTPAFDAGIRPKDRIVAINGESTEGFSIEDATQRLRGPAGVAVRLRIQHVDADGPEDLTLVRAVIHTESVLGDGRQDDGNWNYMLGGGDRLGYVRLAPMFSERTADELDAALADLLDRDARGLILDLRNNLGGLLDAAIDVCDLFVTEGVIVSTRGRDGRPQGQVEASGTAVAPDLPLVLLVNQYSASASEIVAGCLQDHGRARIVGQRTYGKGSVQEIIRIGTGERALRLTTASYWRPSGQNIHRTRQSRDEDAWGVFPDEGYAVTLDGADLERALRDRRQRDILRPAGQAPEPADLLTVDPQLRRAVEALEELIAAQSGAVAEDAAAAADSDAAPGAVPAHAELEPSAS